MVFSSLTFLFFFLPVTAALYFICPKRVWRNAVLLVASLVFYSWGEPKLLLLLIAASLVAYLGAWGMDAAAQRGRARLSTALYVVTLCLLAGNLFAFKYLNFAADNLCALFGRTSALPAVALPIGISFYTFQIMSYVIDLRRGEVPVQKNYLYLLLYISFFPQLIAGPIVRYQTVHEEIVTRRENVAEAAAGARRFVIGLAKKVLLANGIAELVEIIYAGDPAVFGSTMYWLAGIAYALQIYFDFSGYSDMAIGLGRVFGFHFLENFDHPYTSLSVTEFWRRWHISLSTWFRDYIYIPLGGNRVGRGRWVLNILIVWGLTGFWHGAQWNFLLWGLYYGVLLLVEKLWLQKLLERLPKALRWVYATALVVIGWVLFSITNTPQLLAALAQMFRFAPTDWAGVLAHNTSILYGLVYLPLGAVCALPLGRLLPKRESAGVLAVKNAACLILLLLCMAFLISSSYNPFIYFRF